MSVKTTQYITRHQALERISNIRSLLKVRDYRKLEEFSREDKSALFEDFEDFRKFAKTHKYFKKYTNKMLQDIMNYPFFRFSQFENYRVLEDVQELDAIHFDRNVEKVKKFNGEL